MSKSGLVTSSISFLLLFLEEVLSCLAGIALILTRLDMQVGGVPSQMALLCFEPKKVHVFHSCDSLEFLHWIPLDHV